MHTYGRQLNQHPHIHLSVTRGDSLNMTPGNRFSLKEDVERSGAVRSFDSLGITIFSYNPINCLASGTFAIIRPGAVTSMPSFNVIGKYILPKRHAGPGIM
ncbi:transposase [Arsenophonus nasoniae]|uniref:transposase n=1 Tax=Arsenophonus nasoniae TaxID=638 RepID=UPI00387E6760